MIRTASRTLLRSLLGVLLLAAATVPLMSCAADERAGGRSSEPASEQPGEESGEQPGEQSAGSDRDAPDRTPAPSDPTTPSSTPTPSPSLPRAADGKDPAACADGTCEIRLTGPVLVPIPERYDLGSLEVIGIDDRTVSMVAALAGSNFSSGGGCSPSIVGPSGNSTGMVILTCRAGETTEVNGMSLRVVDIVGKAAVLRVAPA